MDEYERNIREKVFAAKILTPGEWVYLVGVFQTARDLLDEFRALDEKINPSKYERLSRLKFADRLRESLKSESSK